MGWLIYILAEILALYGVVLGLGAALILNAGVIESHDLRWLIFIGFAAVALGWSVVAASVGTRFSLLTGFYNPIRLIALVAPAVGQWLRGSMLPLIGGRSAMEFRWTSRETASYDVTSALAAHLSRLGVRHTNAGVLMVADDGVDWALEPVFGETRVTGWVEAETAADRQAVVDAIRAFLSSNLGLRLV